MEHIAAAQRSNPGAAVCYYSAFRLHSNKRHAHRLQKPESGAWLPRDCPANARQHRAGQWKTELLQRFYYVTKKC